MRNDRNSKNVNRKRSGTLKVLCRELYNFVKNIKQTNSSRTVFYVVLWNITHCVRTWNFSIKIYRKEILVIHTEMRVQQQQQWSKNQIDAEKCI